MAESLPTPLGESTVVTAVTATGTGVLLYRELRTALSARGYRLRTPTAKSDVTPPL